MVKIVGKLTEGHLGYLYPSTQQSEGYAGVITEIIDLGGQVHARLQCPNGDTPIYDYESMGCVAVPEARTGVAIVKVIHRHGEPVPRHLAHEKWPLKEIADDWLLCQDPWAHRWHWLPNRQVYNFSPSPDIAGCQVSLEGWTFDEEA